MALLTKSKYLAGLQCSKLLWHLVHDKEKATEFSKEAQYRMDVGTKIGVMATKLYPEGISIASDDFMGNINKTKVLLAERKPLFEAGFMIDGLFSRVDILSPNDDGSWDIIEVKSGTEVKEENERDVSFQKHVLKLAGLNIRKCFLCFVNNQYVYEGGEIDLEKYFTLEDISGKVLVREEGIEERIKEMKEILALPEAPDKSIGKHCNKPYVCNLQEECWAFLPEHNVFTLYRGGKTTEELFKAGVYAIKDIPEGTKLSERQEIQVTCERTEEAHVQKFEIQQFLDSLIYPIYHLDFESFSPALPRYKGTRPYMRIPFQYSVHIEQEDGSLEHKEFLAEGREDPRKALLEQLKEDLGRQGSILVYNQGFEKGVLKELARDFPEYEGWVNETLPRIVDLLVPFRNFHYYNRLQGGGASIKQVLPALTDISYKDLDIAGGGDASISFEEMIFGDIPNEQRAKIREDLLKYCELDTYAEVKIVEKLKELVKES